MIIKNEKELNQVVIDVVKESFLLRDSEEVYIIYKLLDFDENKMCMVNSIETTNKANAILEQSTSIVFEKYQNNTFSDNLRIIDSGLPQIISDALKLHYFYGCNTIEEMLDKIKDLPHYKSFRSDFCEIKFKRFLRACALGMRPSEPWDNVDNAEGGYVIVLPNGERIVFTIYNRALFDQYLVKNTRFERGATSRHDFMSVYKEGSEFFIKLNLQIRFTK